MIYSKAAHPNCMYLWMNYIISPQANAKVAEYFGEAPVEREGLCRRRAIRTPARTTTRTTRRTGTTSTTGTRRRPTAETTEATSARRTRTGDRVDGDQGLGTGSRDDHGRQDRAAAPGNLGRRLSTFFRRHERARLGALLAAPLAWLVVIYLGSLAPPRLWRRSGASEDPLTQEIVHTWTLDNFKKIARSLSTETSRCGRSRWRCT